MISMTKSLRTVLFSSIIFMLSPLSASAVDINLPGFSGSVNTTITSGFSLRASSRDCLLQDGYSATIDSTTLNATGQGALAVYAGTLSTSQLLSVNNKNSEYSGSCAQFQTDGYGNLSGNRIEFGNVNGDTVSYTHLTLPTKRIV